CSRRLFRADFGGAPRCHGHYEGNAAARRPGSLDGPPSWLVDFMPSVLRCRVALTKRHLRPEEVFGRGKPSVPPLGAGATALTLPPPGPHPRPRPVVLGSPT